MARRQEAHFIDQQLPIINPGRCCVECAYFSVDTGSPDYSEYTPGSAFDMDCSMCVWQYPSYGSEEEYRLAILSASRCNQFKDRGK